VDGTLTATGFTATGGSIFGAGSIKANTSVGNATGTAVTINVGDSGKAGLLAITGTYTQLATGTMTGLVNGTVAGSGFSQLTVSGTAALAGTINFTVASGFQSSLFSGETFTVLTASSVTGTFSNATIAINSSFHFTVSYTATGVVLTVASGPSAPPANRPAQPVAQIAASIAKPVLMASKGSVPSSTLRHHVNVVSKTSKPIIVARMAPSNGRSNAIIAKGSELNSLRRWEHLPLTPIAAKPITVARIASPLNSNSPHNNIAATNPWIGARPVVPVHAGLVGWMGSSNNHRVPVKIMPLSPPRMTR